jgi:hypothetical protein
LAEFNRKSSDSTAQIERIEHMRRSLRFTVGRLAPKPTPAWKDKAQSIDRTKQELRQFCYSREAMPANARAISFAVVLASLAHMNQCAA